MSRADPRAATRQRLATALRFVVTGALFFLLARATDWAAVSASLRQALPVFLVAAFVCILGTTVFTGLRWTRTARASGLALGWPLAVRATFAAIFVGQFLPAGIGVDAVRIAALWRNGMALGPAASSLVLDRIAGIAGIFFLALAGLPFAASYFEPRVMAALFVLIAGSIAAGAVALNVDRIARKLRFLQAQAARAGPWLQGVRASLATFDFAQAWALAVLIQLLAITSLYLIGRSLGVTVPYLSLVTVCQLALFASLLPVSVSGWGVREGALVLGVSALGVPRETALLMSLIYGVLVALGSLPGGFLLKLRMTQAPEAEDSAAR